jgi:hypothetical protein
MLRIGKLEARLAGLNEADAENSQSRATVSALQQLRKRLDNAVGDDISVRRHSGAGPIDPHRVNAESLRPRHLPLDVVADTPRLFWCRAEGGHGGFIHSWLRLPETKLPFDEDVVKIALQPKSIDLSSLSRSIPIRDHRKSYTCVRERLEALNGFGEQDDGLFAKRVKALRYFQGQVRKVKSEFKQGCVDDALVGDDRVGPTGAMAIGVGPEPSACTGYRIVENTGVQSWDSRLDLFADRPPGWGSAGSVVDQGIVEVDHHGIGGVHMRRRANTCGPPVSEGIIRRPPKKGP